MNLLTKEYRFKNDNICEFLCDKIEQLCQKYPKPRKSRKNEEEKVPVIQDEQVAEKYENEDLVEEPRNGKEKLGSDNSNEKVADEIQDIELCMADMMFGIFFCVSILHACIMYYVHHRFFFHHPHTV